MPAFAIDHHELASDAQVHAALQTRFIGQGQDRTVLIGVLERPLALGLVLADARGIRTARTDEDARCARVLKPLIAAQRKAFLAARVACAIDAVRGVTTGT